MSVWNPFVFAPDGQPNVPQARPALRVYGGQATASQMALAQFAFHKFCARARLSAAPNPTEQGFLSDGSRYVITVIGPQTTMELWVGSSEDLRPSGISFTLSNLDGSLIPAHSIDGVPTIYLLTPRVNRGSRISNGRWTVRKPKFVQGGKVVNAGKSGLRYYAAVPGALNSDIPSFRDYTLPLTAQGYFYDDYQNNDPLWSQFKQVGRLRENNTPIPFLYAMEDGSTLAMQLVIRYAYDPEDARERYFIDLYVGPFNEGPDAQVGDLVSTEKITGGTIRYHTFTFSADGHTARAVGVWSGALSFLSVDISPTGTVTSLLSVGANEGPVNGVRYLPTDVSTTVGGVTTRVEGEHEAGAVPVNQLEASLPVYSGSYTFSRPSFTRKSFGRRGQPIDDPVLSSSTSRTIKSKVTTISSSSDIEVSPGQYYRKLDRSVVVDVSDRVDGLLIFGNRVAYTTVEYTAGTILVPPDVENIFTLTDPGTYESIVGGIPNPVFIDAELDLSVDRYGAQTRTHAVYIADPEGFGPILGPETITVLASARVLVRCQGAALLDAEFSEPAEEPVIFFAADPMTGAMVLHVQIRDATTYVVSKAWTFVIDSTGGRPLSDILPGTAPTAIKITSNASLISV